jgi:ribosomal protein L22
MINFAYVKYYVFKFNLNIGVIVKKILSQCLSLLLCFSILSTSSYATIEKVSTGPLSQALELQKIVSQFKHQVFVEKKDAQLAMSNLAQDIINKNFTIADLQLYVQLNASKQESEKFNEVLLLALENSQDLKNLNAQDLSFVLQNAMTSTNVTGANFMSCGVGLGVGIPMLAVGVIVGIIALVNSTASKELVTQQYIEERSATTTSYLNTKADLELELTTYNSDIIYYNDEIAELNRKISSGNYSASDIERMKTDIRDYEFFISDKVALIGEVNVDIDYFNSKYESDIISLNQEEVSQRLRVDERIKNSKTQAIVAGISTALGASFLLGGMKDCN